MVNLYANRNLLQTRGKNKTSFLTNIFCITCNDVHSRICLPVWESFSMYSLGRLKNVNLSHFQHAHAKITT